MYTCITGQIASLDQACINLLHHVEQFVENNPDFQLIVKPHTSEMLWFNHVRYEVSPKTIFIAHHTEDCAMERIVRINVDEVVHSSDVVISLSSSAMITPLILDIPLIHFEMDNHLCHDLAQTGKGAFYSISDPMTVGQAIQNAILNPLFGASKLAEKFNFKNDGKATGRIVEAIEQVIAERHKGRSFYTSIEEEFIECIKRYPFLPYPLKSLFEYYCSEGDIASAEEILNEYCQKFKDPTPLIKLLVSKCSTIGDTERILKNLILYNQYKPLTPELVHMYKMALLESDIKSAYGK
jgi:hypothetical protein